MEIEHIILIIINVIGGIAVLGSMYWVYAARKARQI
jgi:hypothetical protein